MTRADALLHQPQAGSDVPGFDAEAILLGRVFELILAWPDGETTRCGAVDSIKPAEKAEIHAAGNDKPATGEAAGGGQSPMKSGGDKAILS